MGGSCFEQLGDAPSASDRELPELDNFYPVQSEGGGGGVGGDRNLFDLDGKEWPTTEHYFQAAKYPQNETLQEQIRTAPSCTAPGGCYQLGNAGAGIRADWEAVKVDVMYAANLAKFQQNPQLREILISTRGRIRAKGAQDMWATWNAILLERIREELRESSDRDKTLLETRVAMMAAYRSAAQGLPGERAERAVTAITRQAAARELPCDTASTSPSSITITGCNLDDADWVNAEYWVDPLQQSINGYPHYMTSDESEQTCGHLYVGLKDGQAKWVLDEELDPQEIGGTLTLPVVPAEAPVVPSGDHAWEVYGGAKVHLCITLGLTKSQRNPMATHRAAPSCPNQSALSRTESGRLGTAAARSVLERHRHGR